MGLVGTIHRVSPERLAAIEDKRYTYHGDSHGQVPVEHSASALEDLESLSSIVMLSLSKAWGVLLFQLSGEARSLSLTEREQIWNQGMYSDPLAWAVAGYRPLDYPAPFSHSFGYHTTDPERVKVAAEHLEAAREEEYLRLYSDEVLRAAEVYRWTFYQPKSEGGRGTLRRLVYNLRRFQREAGEATIHKIS